MAFYIQDQFQIKKIKIKLFTRPKHMLKLIFYFYENFC